MSKNIKLSIAYYKAAMGVQLVSGWKFIHESNSEFIFRKKTNDLTWFFGINEEFGVAYFFYETQGTLVHTDINNPSFKADVLNAWYEGTRRRYKWVGNLPNYLGI